MAGTELTAGFVVTTGAVVTTGFVVAVGLVVTTGFVVAAGLVVATGFVVAADVQDDVHGVVTLILQQKHFFPFLAEIVVVPAFFAVTFPLLFTVATFLLLDFHVMEPFFPLSFSV